MVGYDNLILGSAIPGVGAKDGISVADSRLNKSEAVNGAEEKTDSGTEDGLAASTGSLAIV